MTSPHAAVLAYADAIARTVATGPGGLRPVSVIVHGSVAFGDYVAGRSDLDLLVVGDLPSDGLLPAADAILGVATPADIRGLECSVVSLADVADLTPSRPFRLHTTVHDGQKRVVPGPGHPGDQDLTLHYAVAGSTGIGVWGAAPSEVIPTQPPALVTRALISELRWAADQADPLYAVLNAARALAYAADAVMLSKLGGWLWSRRHGGPAPLLDAALSSYLTPSSSTVDWPARRAEVLAFLHQAEAALRAGLGEA